MKTIYKIIIGLIIALGGIHVLFTFGAFDKFSADAIWFASAGVGMLLAGFLNIVFLRDAGGDRVVRILCLITNLVLFVIFVLLLLIFPEPHIFFGAGLFFAATLFLLKLGA